MTGTNELSRIESTVKLSSHASQSKPPCHPLAAISINTVGFSTLTHCPVFGVHYVARVRKARNRPVPLPSVGKRPVRRSGPPRGNHVSCKDAKHEL